MGRGRGPPVDRPLSDRRFQVEQDRMDSPPVDCRLAQALPPSERLVTALPTGCIQGSVPRACEGGRKASSGTSCESRCAALSPLASTAIAGLIYRRRRGVRVFLSSRTRRDSRTPLTGALPPRQPLRQIPVRPRHGCTPPGTPPTAVALGAQALALFAAPLLSLPALVQDTGLKDAG